MPLLRRDLDLPCFLILALFRSCSRARTYDADSLSTLRVRYHDQAPRLERPTSKKRCSDSEWSGSLIVIDNGSPNTVLASENEMPCCFRSELPYAHSTRIGGTHGQFTSAKLQASAKRTQSSASSVPYSLLRLSAEC
jgi:hypothetical protein